MLDSTRTLSSPDERLTKRVIKLLEKNSIGYQLGSNISVPAITFQRPHDNEDYRRIKPHTVDMELASFYSRSKDLGIRATAILVISDNRSEAISDETKRKKESDAKTKILELIINNLESLKLPRLKVKKEFSIDEPRRWYKCL